MIFFFLNIHMNIESTDIFLYKKTLQCLIKEYNILGMKKLQLYLDPRYIVVWY